MEFKQKLSDAELDKLAEDDIEEKTEAQKQEDIRQEQLLQQSFPLYDKLNMLRRMAKYYNVLPSNKQQELIINTNEANEAFEAIYKQLNEDYELKFWEEKGTFLYTIEQIKEMYPVIYDYEVFAYLMHTSGWPNHIGVKKYCQILKMNAIEVNDLMNRTNATQSIKHISDIKKKNLETVSDFSQHFAKNLKRSAVEVSGFEQQPFVKNFLNF